MIKSFVVLTIQGDVVNVRVDTITALVEKFITAELIARADLIGISPGDVYTEIHLQGGEIILADDDKETLKLMME